MRLAERSTTTALVAAAAVSAASYETCVRSQPNLHYPDKHDADPPQCDRLASALGDIVTTTPFTANDWFSIQESTLVPACIVRPRSAQDVSKAVTILNSSRAPGCQFAVKGGGHTPAGGFANIQGGVTFDMGHLNATALSKDETSVTVGAGAVWNDVYGYLDDFNLAAAGGRNGLVGVGGLLLGGGISHFSPRVGWACDGVVGYEVCTDLLLHRSPELLSFSSSRNLTYLTRSSSQTAPLQTSPRPAIPTCTEPSRAAATTLAS